MAWMEPFFVLTDRCALPVAQWQDLLSLAALWATLPPEDPADSCVLPTGDK